tara:strand:+ start:1854 stop:3002 length:1149 start_codon:yes stop_codon:yes gene_type:complete
METATWGNQGKLTIRQKLWALDWPLVTLICVTAVIGIIILLSSTNGQWEGLILRQSIRFGIALVAMIIIALVDIRFWMRYAYTLYGAAFVMLVAVELMGSVGMGAQRWVDVGIIRLQPSELMKVALVLALSRYFHGCTLDDITRLRRLIIPTGMIVCPVALVLRQPDLGTAILLVFGGGAIFLLAGVKLWKFAAFVAVIVGSLPFAWRLLHDYQRERILTFLDPHRDPLGAGYHILQSKIALGSGGVFGRGYMKGTQTHLNFLPEKQTDFAFTMLAEEFGLIGGLALLVLYTIILIYCIFMSLQARSHFARLLGLGVANTYFLYVFINIAMVTGLIPVVGVPLPLISYGGTAMITLLAGFGLVMCVSIHRETTIPRSQLWQP